MTDPWDDFNHRRIARDPGVREAYALIDARTCLEEWAREMIRPGLCDQMAVSIARIDGGVWVATASWSIMGFWRHTTNMSPDPIPAADGLIRNTNIEQQCLFRPRHKAVGLRTYGVERMARVLYEERAQHRASSGTHRAGARHG